MRHDDVWMVAQEELVCAGDNNLQIRGTSIQKIKDMIGVFINRIMNFVYFLQFGFKIHQF